MMFGKTVTEVLVIIFYEILGKTVDVMFGKTIVEMFGKTVIELSGKIFDVTTVTVLGELLEVIFDKFNAIFGNLALDRAFDETLDKLFNKTFTEGLGKIFIICDLLYYFYGLVKF